MIHSINTSNPREAHFTLRLAAFPFQIRSHKLQEKNPQSLTKARNQIKHHHLLESQSSLGMNSHQQKRNKEKIGTKINQVMQEPD